ncbi:MAG: hypothetical protein ABI128_00100 [Rhodanobacter sp.]
MIADFTGEALAVEVDLNLPTTRAIPTRERVALWRGYPAKLRVDNSPKFVTLILFEWVERKEIALDFIEPGLPKKNLIIECFSGSFRHDVWIRASSTTFPKYASMPNNGLSIATTRLSTTISAC